MSPHNPLEKTTKYGNQVVTIVPKTVETYKGVWLNFIKNRDPLIDTMRITLSEGTEPCRHRYYASQKLPLWR